MSGLRRLTLPVAVAFMALAGCGDDDEDTTGAATTGGATTGVKTAEATQPAGPVSQTIRITETDFKLSPANPKVKEPGTVEFVVRNAGQTEHALEVEGPGGEVETESIAPGKTARLKVKLDKPGSYTMYCPIGNHEEMGMTGRVTVAGGGGGATTPEEPKQDTGSGDSGGSGESGGAQGPGGSGESGGAGYQY